MKQSRGHNMRGTLATQTVVLRPLDCFASLAMMDRELAHLFLRVARACSSQILMGIAVARLGPIPFT